MAQNAMGEDGDAGKDVQHSGLRGKLAILVKNNLQNPSNRTDMFSKPMLLSGFETAYALIMLSRWALPSSS